MRVIIVEDETPTRDFIKSVLSRDTRAELVGEAGTVSEALSVIHDKKPDVVLLDIQLGDETSFDLIKQLGAISFKIIFITAYEEFAVKAFRLSAMDYLLKPLHPDELLQTLDKAYNLLEKEGLNEKLNVLLDNLANPSKDAKKIILKTSESYHVINSQDIIRCESDRNYTNFYIRNTKPLLVSKTLKEYEELLSGYGFFRAHQSHLVNLNYITRYDKRDGGYIVMSDGSSVPVSPLKKEQLMAQLENL